MKITKMYDQSRRDFSFDAECEHCGHEVKRQGGYDDANFHNFVMPKMICPECGLASFTVGDRPTPRYPEGMSV